MDGLSPEQFARLLKAQGPALVLYARQWCAVPEDVVQEAFLELFRQPEPPRDAAAWLYRVVRNLAINASRTAARRRRHEAAAARQGEPWLTSPPEHRLGGQEATEALRRLPDELREVVILRLWGGLSLKEIADVTGGAVSTVHRRYRVALETLRERLGVACPEKTNLANQ
jgi:RNA polymerase sigma factor (sigma-70 family)